MPFLPSLKRGDVEPAQRVTTCSACNAFVEVVGGIRGTEWEREKGLRHFYSVWARGQLRASGVGIRFDVPLGFFPGVFNACGRWLVDHLTRDVDDASAHITCQDLPSWVGALIRDVDFSRIDFDRSRKQHDLVVTVCAELLGISRQQVYAQLASSGRIHG